VLAAIARRVRSAGGGAVGVVLVLLLPGEERAQLLAGRLDRVLGTLLAELQELLAASASWSLMKRSANAPDWMSARTAFMFSFTEGSMTRGPET
jgi:hypothetical protein